MNIRRVAFLLLGLAGSLLVSAVLYISAEGVLSKEAILPTEPLLQGEERNENAFPAAVPGTSVQIERISAYDGPFLEDGSDEEVAGIAAMHIHNTGQQLLSKVCITLQYGEASYVFCGEYIPPGETVVLLEQDRQTFITEKFFACYGWQTVCDKTAQDSIWVTDQSMGTLLVTNLSDRPLYDAQLYYKSWLSPPDVYMGGITYAAGIPVLLPGQTVCLYPPHYAAGYTKVLFVTADG